MKAKFVKYPSSFWATYFEEPMYVVQWQSGKVSYIFLSKYGY
jgi:hypothetical protein